LHGLAECGWYAATELLDEQKFAKWSNSPVTICDNDPELQAAWAKLADAGMPAECLYALPLGGKKVKGCKWELFDGHFSGPPFLQFANDGCDPDGHVQRGTNDDDMFNAKMDNFGHFVADRNIEAVNKNALTFEELGRSEVLWDYRRAQCP